MQIYKQKSIGGGFNIAVGSNLLRITTIEIIMTESSDKQQVKQKKAKQ